MELRGPLAHPRVHPRIVEICGDDVQRLLEADAGAHVAAQEIPMARFGEGSELFATLGAERDSGERGGLRRGGAAEREEVSCAARGLVETLAVALPELVPHR